ncbi:small GTPase [Patellaria atrata CBS 101060]|uniref:Small GTPase n=1 Tax=Patellaria atrata CBS 101060 TaxID=1346257 RepID=A0A9P4SAG9_9PEZI|nr:small GTPase [Patellaria atrata CBS 101060]
MEGDDSNNTTITASTIQQLPEIYNNGYNNQHSHDTRPQTSYSETGFSRSYGNTPVEHPPPYQQFAPPSDQGTPPLHQQPYSSRPVSRPSSRPSSSLSGTTLQQDRYSFSEGLTRSTTSTTYQEQNQRTSQPPPEKNTSSVVIKVGMVGDAQIGKTSLMVKYVEGSWDEDYIQTLGVNFMEKTISIRNTEITFSIWDLGGQREFVNMLPLVCNDAVAILFMFDLTRKSTLNSIKEWYRQGRGFNKTAIPFLVGTKYDHFVNFPREEQEEISNQAKRFAKAMKASLIFSSTSHSINVQKIFKIVLSKAFDLRCTIPEIEHIGEPLLLYQSVG